MTLHPWPLNDTRTGDHTAVLWTGADGLGLLSDSLAVPLRFMPEVASPLPVLAVEPASEAVFNRSALLCLRDIGCRFGSSFGSGD